MNIITLSPDGLLVHNQKQVEPDALVYLGYQVELTQGFTLRSYYRMLSKSPLLATLNDFFPAQLGQYQKAPTRDCTWGDFDYLGFSKTIEMIGFPGKPRLEIYSVFQGVRGDDKFEIKALHLEHLLDMPIKLGRLRHIVFGDKADVFEFETVYSLFEFIDGIAWELSFHGTPKECLIGG